jgi:hypothetical protein
MVVSGFWLRGYKALARSDCDRVEFLRQRWVFRDLSTHFRITVDRVEFTLRNPNEWNAKCWREDI